MSGDLRLEDRTVILTGGTTQIGAGVAMALADLGANVAILDKNIEKAQRIATEINHAREIRPKNGRGMAVMADLSRRHHVSEAVGKVAESFGGVDVYVDGLTIAKNLNFESPEFFEELDRFVDVNLKGPLFVCHEVLKFMKARRRGRIIFLVQDICRIGFSGEALSGVSRLGLTAFSRSLAREVAGSNVTVNCLAIGPTEEYLLGRDPQAPSIHEAQKELLKNIPQAKMSSSDDVSGVVAFLASPLSAGVTGQTIAASGGLTMF